MLVYLFEAHKHNQAGLYSCADLHLINNTQKRLRPAAMAMKVWSLLSIITLLSDVFLISQHCGEERRREKGSLIAP